VTQQSGQNGARKRGQHDIQTELFHASLLSSFKALASGLAAHGPDVFNVDGAAVAEQHHQNRETDG
jgi:hypothetical protein